MFHKSAEIRDPPAGRKILGSTPHPAAVFMQQIVRALTMAEPECLDRLIPIGERHFRRAVTEYVEHDHAERNHQGLLNFYERAV